MRLILILGFEAKLSLKFCAAHSIWHVTKDKRVKKNEKMCAPSMPYIAVYQSKKK